MKSLWKLITFPLFSDERGSTIPFELNKSFPFEVKRVYLVTGLPNQSRGGHSHIIEEEVFVVTSGEVTAILHDGIKETEILLNKKNEALFVGKNCWHEFKNFSKETVLMAFSSTHYSNTRTDYIENKEEFLKK